MKTVFRIIRSHLPDVRPAAGLFTAAAAMLLISCAAPDRGAYTPAETLPETETSLPGGGEAPVVRVLVLETKDRIDISLRGGQVAAKSGDGRTIGRFEVSGTLAVSKVRGGLRLKQKSGPVHEAPVLEVRPSGDTGVAIDDTPYRGGLLLRLDDGGRIQAINIIEIDDYLKGVLPSEIGYLKEGQYEAYRAQAIAARSYSLSKLEEKRNEPYDMRATIMDQVYRGVKGENRAASEAVDGTRGIVGVWEGEPIRAYYSACCGGHTADIRVGWPWKAPFPYLYGRKDAPEGDGARSYCRESRHFRWEVVWSGSDLSRIAARTLPAELGGRVSPFNIIRDIRVVGYSLSGRAVAVDIVTDRGTHRVEGDRIRWVLRPESPTGPILRSTLFKMEVTRGGGRVKQVRLKGGGNGHGVGMCQYGAIRMASDGFSAERIIEHYYPGVSLVRIY
ncbi:MAG TPA: SpoIID/LytB domain-containing protein [Candidatus Eisenbacteria bacterium]|uniref:SpoIID/LytB domain-containing protein n=1 Tax=Eiseniibacteriota bacterium TaxID=2212470 RepID=A0A7V2F4G3_UNCEI|nr:SpoIID/LytB domain-containing protein [Candidatus Eisenbacteria bacterium]